MEIINIYKILFYIRELRGECGATLKVANQINFTPPRRINCMVLPGEGGEYDAVKLRWKKITLN